MGFEGEKMLRPVCGQEYRITAEWEGRNCRLSLVNMSDRAVRPGKITVLEMDMPFPADTPVYGEGYNKLCQYGGTVGNVKPMSYFGDSAHYRLPVPEGLGQVYNMIRFDPEDGDSLLMGFASCSRFSGEFWFDETNLKAVLNLEGIEILSGETVELEAFFAAEGPAHELEALFAAAIGENHPMLSSEEIPTGWCSWLVYGPNVTAGNIYDTLDAIKDRGLNLKYIQLDDGYQSHMGDWLSTTEAFEGGIEKLCLAIKEQGFEPAIWVAPFIAEEKSEVFRTHPDWFVKDEEGKPLASNRVSFGGWRCGPWYMLDGTHPDARAHLTRVFRTMREKWKVKYFKLDANMWGALPFGVRFDRNKTCVEAYRMGMKAILEGVGYDSFLLGCNAPMWPSLGVVHGMRITNDNSRSFETFARLAKECFPRNWQNNKLWINDPDTVLLRNDDLTVLDPGGEQQRVDSRLTREEFLFNAAYTLASGGMVLSSDNIGEFTEQNAADLRKLLPPRGTATVFESADYSVGRICLDEETILCVFNYDDFEKDFEVEIRERAEAADFWTEQSMGVWEAGVRRLRLAGHSAEVIRLYVNKM